MPAPAYVCVGFESDDEFAAPEAGSPKSQAYVRLAPVELVPSKATGSGAVPLPGVAVKLATGGLPIVM